MLPLFSMVSLSVWSVVISSPLQLWALVLAFFCPVFISHLTSLLLFFYFPLLFWVFCSHSSSRKAWSSLGIIASSLSFLAALGIWPNPFPCSSLALRVLIPLLGNTLLPCTLPCKSSFLFPLSSTSSLDLGWLLGSAGFPFSALQVGFGWKPLAP